MNEILLNTFYIVLSIVLTAAATLAVKYIRTKTNWQFKNEIADAAAAAVAYVQQTFVDPKKKASDFGEENQKKALQMALDAADTIMTKPAKEYLNKNRSEIQASECLVALIEEAVRTQKQNDAVSSVNQKDGG